MNSLRDMVVDSLASSLNFTLLYNELSDSDIRELAKDMADNIFDILDIPESEQDKEYKR